MKYSKLLTLAIFFISTSAISQSVKNISLDFTDTKTQKILKIIAKFSNKGLILPSSKLGKTSIYVKNIPWDEVLKGLEKSENIKIEITDKLIVVSEGSCNKTTIYTSGKKHNKSLKQDK